MPAEIEKSEATSTSSALWVTGWRALRKGLLFVRVAGAALLLAGGLSGSREPLQANSDVSATSRAYNADVLADEITRSCAAPKGDQCIQEELGALVDRHGPKAATETAHILEARSVIPSQTDNHHLAHEIGRRTAAALGITGEAFLLCPPDYNYGCQHGFFEHALARSSSVKELLNRVLRLVGRRIFGENRFYCYHGVGHGVMMSRRYDLTASLIICDALSGPSAREGCYQGVFMENVNAAMRGEARTGLFTREESLRPCTEVAERHRHECYINHAGWLMVIFKNDIGAAARACMKAPDRFAGVCSESLGLMVTNPSWQGAALAGKGTGRFCERRCSALRTIPREPSRLLRARWSR